MDPRTILEAAEFWPVTPEAMRQEMIDAARAAQLDKGLPFLCEGDEVTHLAVVGAGRLRVFKTTLDGREITLYHVGPGEICTLNLLGSLASCASPARAEAITPLEAAILPADRFRRWMMSDEALQQFVFQHLALQTVDLMTLVEELISSRLDTRLAGYLDTHAVRGSDGRRSCETTHEQIARELGTAREVVSRLLKVLERRGAVRLARGRVDIVDKARLDLAGDPRPLS